MAQIREDLGDDAIIVATHEEAEGVRVTAAVDREGAPDEAPEVDDLPKVQPQPQAVESEDIVDTVYDSLRRHGLPSSISDPILDEVELSEAATPLDALTTALSRIFRFDPIKAGGWATPMMPVGVPGAGKTQTVVKLAVRALLEGERVAVLTTDVERTGGLAPLSAFTRALKLDLITAHDPTALADGLMAIRDHDVVLIDTPGTNHLDAHDVGGLSGLSLGGKVEQFLVLSAGLDTGEACDIALSFRDLGVKRMVVTRLDVARRLGSVLAAAHTANIAFAEVSHTPMIKNGLAPMNAESLARLLLVGKAVAVEQPRLAVGVAS